MNNGLKRDESINISFTSSSNNNFNILADEELRLSEERFAKAFYSSPVAMAITTLKEYIHLDVNKTWVDIMGYSRKEAIGKTTAELALWVSYIKNIEFRKILSTQGKVHNFEMHFRRKNGKFGTGLTSAEIISMNGEPCLLISVTDITERKEMEEKLIISEREKTGILESITEAFITVDYKCKVTYWNNAAEVMFNKRKADVLGKDIAEVFPSYIESIFNNYIKQLLEKKQPIFFEARSPKTGRWAEARVYPNPKGMAVYVQDITERKQMEMEITRLDRLNVVGEMAVSICHEMRNPMTTVRGYLQLLRENNKNNQSKEYYDLMIEELDRANSILSEFVSLTKNKMMEFKPSDLNEIIIKSLPLIQAQANSKDHFVRLELHELPEMLIDEKEIRQLLVNIVKNGLEAMSAPGELKIETFMENENIVLAIHDKGHGIQQEFLDKLGTPFFTTKEHGNGLGLAVCYRIANRHNAKIHIQTSSGGTTFTIRFEKPAAVDKNATHLKIKA